MSIDRFGICRSCGREYDDLPEYSCCPADDCPSNNEELMLNELSAKPEQRLINTSD